MESKCENSLFKYCSENLLTHENPTRFLKMNIYRKEPKASKSLGEKKIDGPVIFLKSFSGKKGLCGHIYSLFIHKNERIDEREMM